MEHLLSDQIQAMRRRIRLLYQSAHDESRRQELLPQAFEELETALEELQALETELHRQQMQLLDTREHLEAEQQTYRDLFEFAPVAYLITSLDGTIQKTNQTAAALFETVEKFMIGRSLALFVPEGERREFRTWIAQLRGKDSIHELETRMQPWSGGSFDAEISVAVVRGALGRPISLRWIITKSRPQRPTLAYHHEQDAPLQQRAVGDALAAS